MAFVPGIGDIVGYVLPASLTTNGTTMTFPTAGQIRPARVIAVGSPGVNTTTVNLEVDLNGTDYPGDESKGKRIYVNNVAQGASSVQGAYCALASANTGIGKGYRTNTTGELEIFNTTDNKFYAVHLETNNGVKTLVIETTGTNP